jgi:mono/diheme cytochrome c family protein
MRWPLTLALLALAGCEEMNHQPRYDSYEPSPLFADGKSLQMPPDGTVTRDQPALDRALATRPAMGAALLERGRERYAVFCVPCHDSAGYGNGTVPARGFPHPPSLHEPRLRDAPARHVVDVVTNGYGVMYSYADRVPPADRWAIAAYVRALQFSQDAPVASLDAEDLRKLDGGGS